MLILTHCVIVVAIVFVAIRPSQLRKMKHFIQAQIVIQYKV